MRKVIEHILIAVLVLAAFQSNAQTPEESFKTGNQHYADGQYQEAIDAYRLILDKNQESAALYYNLANAHYKLNNIAQSIYYYEKAKELAPADADIRNNAAFAEKMRIDAIQPLPENTLKKWFYKVLTLTTVDGWAYTTVVCMMCFVFLFLGYYFSFGSGRKRAFFVGSVLSMVLAVFSLTFAYNALAKAENNNPAIVFAKEVEVKSEPNLASVEAFKLHEGTKVLVLEAVNNWKKILLADGKSGWIPATDIREL